MVDEVLEFAFQATGQETVQKAFEDLKIKQLAAGEEAKRLATELRGLAGSEGATAEKAEELQRAMIRAQQAASQYGTQARQITTQTRQQVQVTQQQATAVTQSARSFGAMSTALGQVGGVLGNVAPQLGSLGGIVGQVGGAVTGLTGAMGPWGIAIGAATTAIPLLVVAIQNWVEESDHLSAAQSRVVERTNAAVTAMQRQRREMRLLGEGSSTDLQPHVESANAAMQQFNDQLAVSRRELAELEDVQGTVGGGAAEVLEEQITAVNSRIAAQSEALRIVTADYERYGAAQTRAVQRELLDSAEDDAVRAQEGAEDRRARRRSGGRDEGAAKKQRLYEEEQRAAEQLEQLWHAHWEELRRAEVAAHAEAQRQIREARQQTIDFMVDLDNAYIDRQIENGRRQAEVAESNKANSIARAESERAQVMDTYQTLGAGVQNIGNSITDLAGQMIKLAVSGADKGGDAYLRLLDAFLESTAIEYTIKALGEGANAIAAYARYDYAAGTQHLIAAGLAAGVAAATGIGAAAINVPPAPAAGGGAASAQQAGGGGGGQAGPTNITVQLFAPQAVFTEAERGQIIAGGLREARRQGGAASVRF